MGAFAGGQPKRDLSGLGSKVAKPGARFRSLASLSSVEIQAMSLQELQVVMQHNGIPFLDCRNEKQARTRVANEVRFVRGGGDAFYEEGRRNMESDLEFPWGDVDLDRYHSHRRIDLN